MKGWNIFLLKSLSLLTIIHAAVFLLQPHKNYSLELTNSRKATMSSQTPNEDSKGSGKSIFVHVLLKNLFFILKKIWEKVSAASSISWETYCTQGRFLNQPCTDSQLERKLTMICLICNCVFLFICPKVCAESKMK